jgi:hypothetical protein
MRRERETRGRRRFFWHPRVFFALHRIQRGTWVGRGSRIAGFILPEVAAGIPAGVVLSKGALMVRGILVPAALWFFEFLASSCDDPCFGNICDRSENICFLLSCLAGFLTFFRLWFVEFLLSLRSVFGVFALVPAMDNSCVEIFVIEVKIFVFSSFYVRFHYCVWNSCSYCALFWGFRSSFCIASNCVNCKP